MAFERPCLVFADSDGNIYDDPDFHMLAMDASGFGLPRPEDVTPLPDHAKVVLLPNRRALGLDPSTGEVMLHEELAVAALVPENSIITGLPAAQLENSSPELPPLPYAAVGFSHNRFYMCAKKIDDNSPFTTPKSAIKKIKKNGKILKALYPENRLVAHLVDQCALTNRCWGALNFCLGLPEMFLPISPLSCSLGQKPFAPQPAVATTFEPTPQELTEVMLHHAKAVTTPRLFFTLPPVQDNPEASETMRKALELFKQYKGKAITILHVTNDVLPDLAPLSHAGLSGVLYTIRGSVTLPLEHQVKEKTRGHNQSHSFPHRLFEAAESLGLRRMLRYEYFPGISDTEKELANLTALLHNRSIGHLLLGNFPGDPQKLCRTLSSIDNGPVMGFGNFFKRIKKECPSLSICSAAPFCKNV